MHQFIVVNNPAQLPIPEHKFMIYVSIGIFSGCFNYAAGLGEKSIIL